MVNGFFICGVLIFSLAGSTFAQSGRRVETAPGATPQVRQTPNVEPAAAAADDAPEYSESSPNAPRPVSPNRQIVVKVKKDSKKRSKKTDVPKTVAAAVEGVDETDVVKVETNLVTIPVSVYDRNGIYIPNLRQTDFKIFEDGAEQETAYFGASEKPFTVVLLIDTSPSTEYKIEEIRRAATAFVDQLKPQDKVAVIEFDGNVHVLTEATGDRQKIYKAIERADFGGGTALYDAVDFSLRKRLERVEGRKAIVLFTDGVDTESDKADFESTVADAEEADALIFPIYYDTFLKIRGGAAAAGDDIDDSDDADAPPPPAARRSAVGTSSADYARGRDYLNELAAATGGRVFRPEATPGGLTAAFEGIAEELRRQYLIGYYPSSEGAAGERRQIKVRVNRPKLIVRSRDSYIVGGEKPPAENKK